MWVQHQDKDRLELNFVIANVELQTGKRLQPYYDPVDRPRINAWKDLVNDRFQLHDPNDPSNKRTLCTPNDLPRAKKDASEAITRGLMGLAEQGALKSRSDVLDALQRAGFEIARTTPTAISIKNPQGGQNLRLKGSIYEQSFGFSKELRADIERASESYQAERINRVRESQATLDRLTELKRASNQERYPRAEQAITADYVKNLERSSDSSYRNLTGGRANTGMAGQDYQQEPRHNRTAESDHADIDGRRGQLGRNQLHRQQEPQTPMYQDESTGRKLERRLSSADGVLKMTELEQQLLTALEQMQTEQKAQKNALRQMFESTKQDNQALQERLKIFLDKQKMIEQQKNEGLRSLVQHVNNLTEQVQSLEQQVKRLKK